MFLGFATDHCGKLIGYVEWCRMVGGCFLLKHIQWFIFPWVTYDNDYPSSSQCLEIADLLVRFAGIGKQMHPCFLCSLVWSVWLWLFSTSRDFGVSAHFLARHLWTFIRLPFFIINYCSLVFTGVNSHLLKITSYIILFSFTIIHYYIVN